MVTDDRPGFSLSSISNDRDRVQQKSDRNPSNLISTVAEEYRGHRLATRRQDLAIDSLSRIAQGYATLNSGFEQLKQKLRISGQVELNFHPDRRIADGLNVDSLLQRALREVHDLDPPSLPVGRALDSYVEAPVHGEIDLRRDVEQWVADPAFQTGPIGTQLLAVCTTFDIELRWHPGFTLSTAEVPSGFRGPAMPALSRRIAAAGTLDCAILGSAAATLDSDPDSWSNWGSEAEALQHIEQLWHVLVRFGSPRQGTQGSS